MTDFGVPPGLRFPAVADGYWIGLKPLPAGEHTIVFQAIVGDPLAPDFDLKLTYHLTVKDKDHD